jgi:hypothetical protein
VINSVGLLYNVSLFVQVLGLFVDSKDIQHACEFLFSAPIKKQQQFSFYQFQSIHRPCTLSTGIFRSLPCKKIA